MIHVRFKELGQQFLLRTREEWQDMQVCISNAQSGDDAAFQQLRNHAHCISGSAAMFGFAEISACAGQIEQLVRAVAPPQLPDWRALDALQLALGEALVRAERASDC